MEALDIADKLQREKYPNQPPQKVFLILQVIKTEPIWNITYISSSLNVLNVRISAINKKIIKHELTQVLSFNK